MRDIGRGGFVITICVCRAGENLVLRRRRPVQADVAFHNLFVGDISAGARVGQSIAIVPGIQVNAQIDLFQIVQTPAFAWPGLYAPDKTGNNKAAKMAMIAMTTSNSIKVNARRGFIPDKNTGNGDSFQAIIFSREIFTLSPSAFPSRCGKAPPPPFSETARLLLSARSKREWTFFRRRTGVTPVSIFEFLI